MELQADFEDEYLAFSSPFEEGEMEFQADYEDEDLALSSPLEEGDSEFQADFEDEDLAFSSPLEEDYEIRDTDTDNSDMEELTLLCSGGQEEKCAKEKRGRPCGSAVKDMQLIPKKRLKTELLSTNKLVAYLCCVSVCLSGMTETMLETARTSFQRLSVLQRSQWILEWIGLHTRHNGVTIFLISGKEVCINAWLVCLGIPQSTYYSLKKKFLDGVSYIKGPGNVNGKLSLSSQYALAWLTRFAEKHADKMPDSTKMHLPCCLSKTSVYEMMVEDAKRVGEECLSQRHFFRIWRRYLTYIVIPKRSRFTICDVCIKLKTKLSTATEKIQRSALVQLREKHLHQQNKERQKYYKHASKSKDQSSKYLSIIIDAMDQEKTSLPHLMETPKALAGGWRVRTNLMAAIVHGVGIYGFFDAFQWSHGSSYTISVLVHVLSILTTLPDVLYLQLDNCPGQNKNRYMLGFLALLVEKEIFKKIKLSFLMVGHTHEDIDQVFSRFSVWLNRNNALKMPDLITGFEKCYTPKPTGLQMHEVYNFRTYLDMHNISNHSRPHVYKIIKEGQKAVIYYKKWSTDKNWNKCEGTNILKDMNNQRLNLIPPSSKDMDEKVEHDVIAVARFYKDNEVEDSWARFFSSLKEQEENWEDMCFDVINELAVKKRKDQESTEIDADLASFIECLNIPNCDEEIPPPILYSYFRSSASWRVRIVLALKGIDYEYKAVNLVQDGGQQHSEEFKILNPMGQVPAFVIGETVLTQSLAIIDYLEDVYPQESLIPKDPVKKAQARALAEVITAGTQPIQNLAVLQKISEKPEERAEWGRFWIDRGLTAYEKMVQGTAGKYSVGDEVTIADVCLIPQLYNANRFKVDMSKFPSIARITAACSELPAFKAADPSAQPDCPEDLRK